MTTGPHIIKRGFISAKVIAHSVYDKTGTELLTYELEYPRFIHAEFMTHRMLSKNSASSRAIPVKAMHEQIRAVPQAPIHWGKNQPGMQAKEELAPLQRESAQLVWSAARESAISYANILGQIGLHKQAANRVTEPFMQMKVVCSGTEWENFFWLRNHEDAQPEIRELAQAMLDAKEASRPRLVLHGGWHLPYVEVGAHEDGIEFYSSEGIALSLMDAIMVSASCCAQVSYRKNDTSIEKAKDIFNRLINSQPVHASPVEHQATPIDPIARDWSPLVWPDVGATHMRHDGSLWSGNFRWWAQYRQFVKGNAQW